MMLTLADEIMARIDGLCAAHPPGPMARDIAAALATDVVSARRAMAEMEEAGRAKIIRRKRSLHLVNSNYPGPICPVCRVEFVQPKKRKRITCSRSCGVKFSWRDPQAATRRQEAIKAQRRTPEGRRNTEERNRRRWADERQRKRLSDWNRKEWSDPVTRVERSVAIARAHGTPERRQQQRELIKSRWDNPEGRAKLESGIKESKQSPEARAKFSNLLKERWQDPVMREKYLKATEQAREKAREANLGRKQTEEHIAKRVASRRAAK